MLPNDANCPFANPSQVLQEKDMDLIYVGSSAPGRLPTFVRDLKVQSPAAPVFSVLDLRWKCIPEQKQYALAAAFPKERLAGFRLGEEARGETTLQVASHSPPTDGLLESLRGTCFYGGPQHLEQKKRSQIAPSDGPQPQTAGVRARKGAHQTGKSCKQGCVYHFLVKVYAKCANTVVIKEIPWKPVLQCSISSLQGRLMKAKRCICSSTPMKPRTL
jgi:hypothetical protein